MRQSLFIRAALFSLLVITFLTALLAPGFGDSLGMDIYLQASAPGHIKVRNVDAHGQYSNQASRSMAYPAGQSGHRLTFDVAQMRQPIRIDPLDRPNRTITISKLILRHHGLSRQYTGAALSKAIAHCQSMHCEFNHQGLTVSAKSGAPIFFLNMGAFPAYGKKAQLALASSLFMAITLAAWGGLWLAQKKHIHWFRLVLPVAAAGLFIQLLLGFESINLLLALLIALAVAAVVFAAPMLSRQ